MSDLIKVSPKSFLQIAEACIAAGHNLMVTGAPGVGKSDIVCRAASIAGADVILSHPVVKSPVDFAGLPANVDGKAEFLPFGDLRKLLTAKKKTVMFLDDFGQASTQVQAAAMQLLLAREINGHKISKHVTFIVATNRKQDKAGVAGILEPVKSRFVSIVELEPNYKDWLEWAATENINALVRAFVYTRPDLLSKFKATADMTNSPCPRTVTHVARILDMQLPDDLENPMIAGAAGEGFAAELIGYKQVWRDLPDFDRALQHPDDVSLNTSEASVCYALTVGLAARCAFDDDAKDPEWMFKNYLALLDRLPDEYGIVGAKELFTKVPDFHETETFTTVWEPRYGDLLRTH